MSDSETPWTVAYQTPLPRGFSKQEYWSGMPFPFPGDLPDPGIKPTSPALTGVFFITEPPGKPQVSVAGGHSQDLSWCWSCFLAVPVWWFWGAYVLHSCFNTWYSYQLKNEKTSSPLNWDIQVDESIKPIYIQPTKAESWINRKFGENDK